MRRVVEPVGSGLAAPEVATGGDNWMFVKRLVRASTRSEARESDVLLGLVGETKR